MEKRKKNPKASNNISVTLHYGKDRTLSEMIFEPTALTTQFLTHSEGSIKAVSSLQRGKATLIPYSPQNPLLIHGVVRFPSDSASYGSDQDLNDSIRAFVHRHLELPAVYEDLAVHYIFLTWLYDRFNELPYLRIRGDFGSGKTRALNVIGALCYKPIVASGASTVAPLFHILDLIGGTLILDEADFRYSSETADITKILNNGNAKGFPVMRCEMGKSKEFKPKAYNVFSPKVIATRGDYDDDALESRCITLEMNYALKRTDIPMSLPDDFDAQALALRNKLLTWRFNNYKKTKCTVKMDSRLDARTIQIYAPLISMVKDAQTKDKIISFAKENCEQALADRGLKTEAELLRTIRALQKQNANLSIGNITKAFIGKFGRRYERKITPHWIGYLIRKKLRLASEKRNGVYIVADGQLDRIDRLCAKFDVAE